MPKTNKAREWPADRVERWPVADLVPYARNSRQHSEEQVAQIARSIEEFGFTVPVLADEDGGIIAGHGRIMAAQRLGLTEVPVMVARGWSDEKKRAYVIADNKLAENASWDADMLRIELAELQGLGTFDLALTGFSTHEIDVAIRGWNPDLSRTNVEADLADMHVTIKVRCKPADEDAVRDAVRVAIETTGIEGVEID